MLFRSDRQTIISMLGQLFYNTGSRADSFFRFVCGSVTILYAAGLTSMSMAAFLIATGIGQLPATIVYSYVGGMLTGSVKMVVTALLLIFALSVFVALAKKIYTDKHSK